MSIGANGLLRDVADAHRPPQADRRDDRELRGGIGAVHVLGRIRLGEAGRLRLRERVGERQLRRLHPAQDVRARAVQNAAHLDEPIAGEAFLQRAEHRNAAGHRRLEPQLLTAHAGQVAELRAVMGDELLVGGHDRLAGQQCRTHPLVGRMQPADELDDDVHVARQHVVDVLGPLDRGRNPVDALAGDAPVENVHELDAGHMPLAENLRDGLAHGAEPEQADAYRVNGEGRHTPYP